jgi:hypothetical protein
VQIGLSLGLGECLLEQRHRQLVDLELGEQDEDLCALWPRLGLDQQLARNRLAARPLPRGLMCTRRRERAAMSVLDLRRRREPQRVLVDLRRERCCAALRRELRCVVEGASDVVVGRITGQSQVS